MVLSFKNQRIKTLKTLKFLMQNEADASIPDGFPNPDGTTIPDASVTPDTTNDKKNTWKRIIIY